jgi:uroporphyrinogen decarboxylase
MGYAEMLTACVKQPDLVVAIVEKGVDHSIKIAEMAAELGADLAFSGDDIADSRTTLISPKMWEDLFAPHLRRLVNALHSFGLCHWKHSDGNIMPVIDSLVDAGIDGIDPIDPLGGMDLALVKQQYGDRVAIKGNVDCARLLVDGTEEAVVGAVKECIRIAGPGGGYVCSSSNSIHDGVNPKLYKAMVDAIHTYCVYPLDMDRLASTSAN